MKLKKSKTITTEPCTELNSPHIRHIILTIIEK